MLESKHLPREIKFNAPPEKKDDVMKVLLAPPGFWSSWHIFFALFGPGTVTVTVESIAQSEGGFDAEVGYIDENGQRKIVNAALFGEITFKAGQRNTRTPDAQEIAVRVRSHINGQPIRVRVKSSVPVR